ncbi:S-adenosyl-L-homocysteine hydrolase, NAD binding domain [seawater metagenome]|uniref:S-adenosyl-L-homocysteine hydrolase, NAD binding domain n=1 Tax=seawater metagenome TaxID=1561972 RepID=A0A5E8CHU5_9ZZZZ
MSKSKLDFAINQMSNLVLLSELFPGCLKGLNILGCSHLTKETGVLIKTLYQLGANINWCASNIYSSQNDIVDEIKKHGWCHKIKGKKNMDNNEFWNNILEVLNFKDGRGPDIIIDNGITLTALIHVNISDNYIGDKSIQKIQEIRKLRHKNHWDKIKANVKLFIQQTTSGHFYLRWLEEKGLLFTPVIDINSSITKCKIDNRYGCANSCIEALKNAKINLSGINVMVVGYGNVGTGIATALRDNKAYVYVAEIDPICALKATMEGFHVDKIKNLIGKQDLIITCTGRKQVITTELILMMKNGAKIGNMGYSNFEIDIEGLKLLTENKETILPYVEKYSLVNKKEITLLSSGELINLSLGEGHPSHIMSLTHSNIIYAILDFVREKRYSENKIYYLDRNIQNEIAMQYLNCNNIRID